MRPSYVAPESFVIKMPNGDVCRVPRNAAETADLIVQISPGIAFTAERRAALRQIAIEMASRHHHADREIEEMIADADKIAKFLSGDQS